MALPASYANAVRGAIPDKGCGDQLVTEVEKLYGLDASLSSGTWTLNRDTTTENQRLLYLTVTPTDLTHGVRQGALGIYVNRTSSYALTSWDGNPDCAAKIQAYNRAVNTTSNGGVRGVDILARNRDSGSCSWLNGAYINAENSTGSGGVDYMYGAEIHVKNNAVASGNVIALRVYDESQSGTGTNYAISIDCTNNSPFTREYCIHINSGASSGWTNGLTLDGNITNALDFADNDGTNGATLGTYSSADANPSGHIKIDVGGATRYIYLYTNAVTFS